ncbi:RagB/SusD family nutrient uptake outer membrane protein [Paraflavisolibacter sp. H34]|uniref:RagB/SusD family nutrient uptake outer membrane protein n=1 Tax=Huijunlia imazamoxiresistens TaxID=3127457 RepID=UPI00301A6C62
MKKIFIYLFVLAAGASCKKSFLDTEPTDRFTQDNFWKTREEAEAALNSTYAALLHNGLFGSNIPVLYEVATPNAYNSNNTNGFNNIAQGIHDAANSAIINNAWNGAYAGIGRANNLLANLDNVPLDSTLKKRFRAEAQFLRAVFYFHLWNRYGGAPLITEATNYETQSTLPRDSAGRLLQQVVADLDAAAAGLPATYTSADKGRATKGAALALKARALLYAGRWAEAAAAAKAVIDSKTYSLFPDYRALFYLENEGNAEVIFDIQFRFPEFTHGLDIALDQFNTVAPLPDLVNDYYAKDGLPIQGSPLYNAQKPYDNRDPRLQQTIIVPGSQFKGAPVVEGQYPQTGYGQKKYSVYKDNEKPSLVRADGQSELNIIWIRYADVLLTYAEAQNEAAGPDESVYAAVNAVRKRAGMPDFPTGLNQEQLRREIRHERRIELAGEGAYYFDLRRWRTAETALPGNLYNVKGAKIGARTFNAGRDYLWPVPSVAIQNNPALTQNPNYGK